MSITVFSKFSKKIPMEILARIWAHSLASATAVNAIGQRDQELGVEKTYIGGLLHDIGKLALHLLLGEDYLSLVNQTASGYCLLLELENRVLGCHHAHVGEWLAQKWHFPRDLQEVIAFHHHPLQGGLQQPKTVATIYLANHLAKRFVGTVFPESAPDPLVDEVLRLLGVTVEEVEQMGDYIRSRERMLSEMISVIS
jgi:putative nucleotidyltransferase with HDIG domain